MARGFLEAVGEGWLLFQWVRIVAIVLLVALVLGGAWWYPR